jgi:cation transport protein ChaC
MPQARAMSLTQELVDLCHRLEVEAPRPALSVPLTDDDFRVMAERIDSEAGDAPLWAFAYGSLIWKPGFEALEQRRATAYGWHRDFNLQLHRFRGTPANPGLMMSLSRGGRCDGVILRMCDEKRVSTIEQLLRREMDDTLGADATRWITVRSDGPTKALGCWVGPRGWLVQTGFSLVEVADVLARACGHGGSCAEYVFNTVSHLEALGIHDRNLWRLQRLVAERIRELHGLKIAA